MLRLSKCAKAPGLGSAPLRRNRGAIRCKSEADRSALGSIDVFADLSTIDLGCSSSGRWSDDAVFDGARRSLATSTNGSIAINSAFDSGNIDVLSCDDPFNIQLRIREDPFCETDGRSHYQWFYFRVTGAQGKALRLNIVNAGGASYPEGFVGYNACCSYDRVNWFRVPSQYDEATGVFTIPHTPEHGAVFYAYFAPYTYDRHMQLIANMQMNPYVTAVTLGETPDGHDLDLLIVGDEAEVKKKVWIIARQHPGESMAEWFVEGLLQRLTDRHDSVARDLLERQATLYIVPNMNPDGTWRGHLRTDANGVNMNRAWAAGLEGDSSGERRGPEAASVQCVLRKMRETGCDLLVDVHGDEVLPHNFIACAEGIPGWTEKMAKCKEDFSATLQRAHPQFTTKAGYEIDAPGTANMGLAVNRVAQEFGCFAMTLEMPFKDCADHPDPEFGWSPERCKRFGASFLSAVRQIVPSL